MIYSSNNIQIFLSILIFFSMASVSRLVMLFDEEYSRHSPCINELLLCISSEEPFGILFFQICIIFP